MVLGGEQRQATHPSFSHRETQTAACNTHTHTTSHMKLRRRESRGVTDPAQSQISNGNSVFCANKQNANKSKKKREREREKRLRFDAFANNSGTVDKHGMTNHVGSNSDAHQSQTHTCRGGHL